MRLLLFLHILPHLLRLVFCLASPSSCPTECSSIHNVSFPFGTQDSCGLDDFRLDCDHKPPLWRVLASQYKVLNITHNDVSSGNIVVENDADLFTCNASSIPKCSDSPFGLEFVLAPGNINLLYECNSSSRNISRASDLGYSSTHCLDFYSACYRNECKNCTVPCFEVPAGTANASAIQETYQCKSKTSFFRFPKDNKSKLEFQLNWSISQSYYDCAFCRKTKGSCSLDSVNNSFVCSCPGGRNFSRSCRHSRHSSKAGLLKNGVQFSIGASAIALAIIIVGASFGIYCCCKAKTVNQIVEAARDANTDLKFFLEDQCGRPVHQKTFSYEELLYATNSFSVNKILGDGGFGTVYEGTLYNGQKVAVKRLYAENVRRLEQFLNEIRILSSLIHHPNLVKLYGFCCQKHEDLLLVYEFVYNGTLAHHLHGNAGKGLLWETRLNIALETAQALAYLHSCVPPILHRDVKSTNILLDENFHVKVADFGLSRFVPVTVTHVSTAPQGTPGYVDPEYHHCYQLNDKSDVYSFGVVLVELVSGKAPVDLSRDRMEINLSSLAVTKIQTGALDELIDPYLEVWRYRAVKEMVKRVAELAFQCLALSKDDRPPMKSVVETLMGIKAFGYGDERGKKTLNTSVSRDDFRMDETSKLIETSKVPTSLTSVKESWPNSVDNSVASSDANGGKRQTVLDRCDPNGHIGKH